MTWPYAVGGGTLVLTLLAWLGRFHPILEMLPNARSQMLVMAAVVSVGLVFAKAPESAAVALLAVAINGWYVVPYWFPSANVAVVASESKVSVLQYNIFYNNDDAAAIAGHVLKYDADIAVLHELLPSHWDAMEPELSKRYPHQIAEPFRAKTGQLSGGMAILSKQPLERLPVDATYSPDDRVLLAAETEIEGRTVTLIGLHPHASRHESRKVNLRKAQIDGVVELVRQADGPVIVAADMNVTPTSPVYSSFLNRTGWEDPHKNVGWHSTFPTWGWQFGFPIDHVFVSNEMEVVSYETGDGAGSDHRSLFAEIVFVEDES